jgi:hypothetical protein
MRKTWIGSGILAGLSTLVLAAAPAMAHQFTASKPGKTTGKQFEPIEIPEKPAQPEFIPERMQEFRLGKFRILCYTESSRGEIGAASETFETVDKYGRCGWYPQLNALHIGTGTSKTGLKIRYHANGYVELVGNGEGESFEYKGIGARETAILFKVNSSKACNIAIPEQTLPVTAVKNPTGEFLAVTFENQEVETERLKVFPSGFQEKVLFTQEIKAMKFKYVGPETQCANLEEFEKFSEEEGGGAGVYKGKILMENVSGNLHWE